VVWQLDNVVGYINEFNLRQALLVLGQVTIYRWVNHITTTKVNSALYPLWDGK